jgi:hypothetical protein
VLVPSAAAYDRICRAGEATTRKTRKIDGALVSLLRCTHSAWKAPALLAVRELSDAPRQLEPFLADFERLACVLMINGTDPNQIQERYFAVIRTSRKGLCQPRPAHRRQGSRSGPAQPAESRALRCVTASACRCC